MLEQLFVNILDAIPNFVFAAIGMYLMYMINIAQRGTINRLIDIIDKKCMDDDHNPPVK